MPVDETTVEIDVGCSPEASSGSNLLLEQCERFTRVVFNAVALNHDGQYRDVGIAQIEFWGVWLTQYEFRAEGDRRPGELDLGTGFFEVQASRWKAERIAAAERQRAHLARIHSATAPDARHYLVVGSGARLDCLAERYSFQLFDNE